MSCNLPSQRLRLSEEGRERKGTKKVSTLESRLDGNQFRAAFRLAADRTKCPEGKFLEYSPMLRANQTMPRVYRFGIARRRVVEKAGFSRVADITFSTGVGAMEVLGCLSPTRLWGSRHHV
jgi:hypothetical protein